MGKRHMRWMGFGAVVMVACTAAPRAPVAASSSLADDGQAVAVVLDDWHAAAAASDESRYFSHLSDDAVFLGTDASERWTKAEFRAYAKAPFANGRGWNFRSLRRDVVVEGRHAWFDEDLATPNLGPARGSGVLRKNDAGRWLIVHYNLTITVPNEQLTAVRDLLAAAR